MIHQAMGRGALVVSEDQRPSQKLLVATELAQILHRLLPLSSESAIENTVRKIIEKAVELKLAMSEEQALYSGIWVEYGAEVGNRKDVEIPGCENPVGHLLLCTHPGLARAARTEGKKGSAIIVVKASGTLQSEFEASMG